MFKLNRKCQNLPSIYTPSTGYENTCFLTSLPSNLTLSFKRSVHQIGGKWSFIVFHVPDLDVEHPFVGLLAVLSSLSTQFMTFAYFSIVLSLNFVYDILNCNRH